jgi:hypothetical protein
MQEGQVDYVELLGEYRRIWNNRLLAAPDSAKEILEDAIKRELLDENSHPRIRKNKFEKYYSATNRVVQSTIPAEAKVQLIHLHTQVMEELT